MYATLTTDTYHFMFHSHRFLDEYYSQFDDRVSQSHVDNSNARMDPYATDYEQETITDQQVIYLGKRKF